jgi:hypothetical protein
MDMTVTAHGLKALPKACLAWHMATPKRIGKKILIIIEVMNMAWSMCSVVPSA